jgi:hypothetical protein
MEQIELQNELKIGFLTQLPSKETLGASETALDTLFTFHQNYLAGLCYPNLAGLCTKILLLHAMQIQLVTSIVRV